MNCSSTKSECQPFPKKGQLAKNLNLNLDTICKKIDSEKSTVYYYIVDTIENQNGSFVQRGCGPNFQGGFITLCTCRPDMRAYKDVSSWKDIWIAGFSNKKTGNGRQALVYLMKVGQAFEAHMDLWLSITIPERTKQAKLAHLHKCGDIYQPQNDRINKFNPYDYIFPRNDHRHAPNNYWHKDIDYFSNFTNRRPSLLVGVPEFSFLWNKPQIFSPIIQNEQIKKSDDLREFLLSLDESL